MRSEDGRGAVMRRRVGAEEMAAWWRGGDGGERAAPDVKDPDGRSCGEAPGRRLLRRTAELLGWVMERGAAESE